MHMMDVMAIVMEVMDIVFCEKGDNDWVKSNEMVMEVMDIDIGLKF